MRLTGFQTQLFGTARNGTGAAVPTAFTWSVDASDAARLSIDTNGVITGSSAVSARVTATAPNGLSGSTVITLEAAVPGNAAVYRNHVEFRTSDYTNGGYDRGLMMRSADRTLTNYENATTLTGAIIRYRWIASRR